MKRQTKLVVLGKPGSFHDAAARQYFGASRRVETVSVSSFIEMAHLLKTDPSIHYAVMALENTLAGSLLPNYDILRANSFWISGEVYLRVNHHLLALEGQKIEDIKEIHSHPMAINQCKEFLGKHPNIRLLEAADTATAASKITEGQAAIASSLAADIYERNIIAPDIEDSKANYTRFGIISRSEEYSSLGNADKASIYLRTAHTKGSLLQVMQRIADHDINICKLQSFPVKGEFNTYYFHLDLEFDHISQYESCIDAIKDVSQDLDELGIYRRAHLKEVATITNT